MIITLQEFWMDFDRKAGSLNTSVVSAAEDSGTINRCIYFDGAKNKLGVIRIYARLISPAVQTNRIIIVMDDLQNDISGFDASAFTAQGFAVLLLDYAGEGADKKRFTVYPPEFSFANYYQNPSLLTELPSSNTESCRYIWATILLRSITFLESEGYEQIGLYGIGEGGSQAIKALALEPSLICGAIRFSQQRVTENAGDRDKNEYDSAFVSYAAALSDKSYCPFIKPPIFFQLTSNEENSSLDDMNRIVSSCTESEAFVSIAPKSRRTLNKEHDDSLLLFFHATFDGDTLIEPPKITAKNSENNLYINITTHESAAFEVVGAQLFVTQSHQKSAFRNWRSIAPEKTGEGEFLAKIFSYSADPIYAFFNVTYANGLTLSSTVLTILPKNLGILTAQHKLGRLIYSAEHGTGEWLDIDSDLPLSLVSGPFEIEGVFASSGRIATFAVADARYAPPENADLQLIVHSMSVQDLSFNVTCGGGLEYSVSRTLLPEQGWAKINLSASDFRAPDGVLSDWREIVMFSITAQDSFIVNTMLWI